MKKSKSNFSFVFWLSGIIFLLFGIYFNLNNAEFKRNGITTTAEIVAIEKYYDLDDEEEIDVYVQYTVGNTIYKTKLDYYSDFLSEGDIITIIYLPENPHKITYAKFNMVPQILLFTAAGICFIAGFVSLFWGFFSRLKRYRLKGNKVIATIKKFYCQANFRILNKYVARLVCVDAEGNQYETRFLYDNRKLIEVGSQIVVYVNKKNPKKYAIDVEQ